MRLAFGAAGAALISAGMAAADAPEARPRYGAAVFGGIQLDNEYEDVLLQPHDLSWDDSWFLGVAGSARVAQPFEPLDIELEAQLVGHFGENDHLEINAPVVTARWNAFPWDRWFDTTAAYGLGLSWASEEPKEEIDNEGETEQLLAYWMVEVGFALPPEDWELIGRLHHRSSAFGLFGDEGGANGLALGLRRRF